MISVSKINRLKVVEKWNNVMPGINKSAGNFNSCTTGLQS